MLTVGDPEIGFCRGGGKTNSIINIIKKFYKLKFISLYNKQSSKNCRPQLWFIIYTF